MTMTHPTLGENRLPNNPLLSEILALVSKQKTKAKKIQILKENESMHIKSVLIWNFDTSVESAIPEGEVPFKKNEAPAGTEHTYLAHEWKMLYNFVKGGNDILRPVKREQLFLQLLEGLHPDEAEIICLVKDKNLKKKYKLTRAVVEEAFPDIEWGNRGS
tara:strand:+ start:41 stop:520 length:480 start_codon:yes stop_codon:yes gene_type:complete